VAERHPPSPEPGWRPDPAWSTPPGWRWIRRRSRLPIVLAGVGALALLTPFGLEIAAEANGHSLDPTDPMNYNSYAIRNDSSTPLYTHLCADPNCVSLQAEASWVAINPGSVDDEQVYWGSSTTAYAVVRSPSDVEQRCLLLNTAHKAPTELDVPLSSAGACG